MYEYTSILEVMSSQSLHVSVAHPATRILVVFSIIKVNHILQLVKEAFHDTVTGQRFGDMLNFCPEIDRFLLARMHQTACQCNLAGPDLDIYHCRVEWPLAQLTAHIPRDFRIFGCHLTSPILFSVCLFWYYTSMNDYRHTEFAPVTAQGVYLNHAGVAPTPARVMQAVKEALDYAASNPLGFFIDRVLTVQESARKRLARLMGVTPEHLAFTKNTGHGLALVADALRLEPGDNVVSVDCEYPSVVYPWYAQAERGIETRLVTPRADGTFTPDDLDTVMDDKSRVLTLSWVQFGTGFRCDLAACAEMAHARGALFVVDVIQGLGALPLEAEKLGLDIVVTGAHKWLIAPGGTGGLYIAPPVLERMRLVNMGAMSVVDVPKFDPLDFSPKPDSRRYEEGTPNGLGLCGLDAALSLLEEVGIDAIATQVLSLTAYLANKLDQKGYRVSSPRADSERGGLVMFQHPTYSNESILQTLTDAGVTAAVRGGKVRFSPHFYNTFAEMDIAVDALTISTGAG